MAIQNLIKRTLLQSESIERFPRVISGMAAGIARS